MALFSFGRKTEAGKGYSFTEIPLFSNLSPAEIRLLEKKFRLAEFKRGDLVYEEGKPADAFYVIVSGRFRVFHRGRGDGEKTIVFLYRGDYFGESSLLTGQAHSACVEARSDGILLRLDKEDFLKTLSNVPALSLHLSRTLGHRLTKADSPGRKKQDVKVAAIHGLISPVETFQFVSDLATNLVRETKARVVFVDFFASNQSGMPEDFQPRPTTFLHLGKTDVSREGDLKPALLDCASGFQYLPVEVSGSDELEKRIAALVTFLSYRYDFLLIRLGRQMEDASFKALKQADLIYLLVESKTENLSHLESFTEKLEKNYAFASNEIKVVLCGGNPSDDTKVFQILPSRSTHPDRYHSVMRFITKELAGTLVGLVLGSRAAYGLAHIGVLRVLEKENIPIDILAGSSMGALIAAFYAAGLRSADLEKMAKSLDRNTAFFKLVGFGDLSLAHHGFLHGRQVTRFMESYLSDVGIQDLQIPVKILATSLTTSQAVVFESGRVVDALRASISIPGIFRPMRWKGELLIDGGILNPLPVDVLTRLGVKKIIAVNVLNGPEDRAQKSRFRAEKKRKLFAVRSRNEIWKRFIGPISERVRRHFEDNIFNVIMNTIQFMEYEIAEVSGQDADVLIRPIVHDAHWAEFYKPEKFIRSGEEKTLEQIDEIKRLVAE